ncbi:MAG TPA: trypsin-like peptidase domain-containing protein [Candidatus Methylacidiphilales bacterium]|nr:trypsin-like peptidase domain-containing protein [Candidatus Methylacidiphilales bacterium]
MKRLFCLTLLLTTALSGCGKASSGVADDKNKAAPGTNAAPTAPVMSVAFTPDTNGLVAPQEVPLLEQIDRENTRVVAVALPSIVRISATHPDEGSHMGFFGRQLPFPFPGMPDDPHHHFAVPNDTSFGSGVIISKDGYIVTNNHVVDQAKSIQVELADKRSFPAHFVAADDLVDIAVLKIDGAGDLQPLPWGDSDKVEVGQQVFAIGDPYDFDDSVSKGIVSAKGRNLPDTSNYEDYIQTDAAVNPGNSGGALINIYGQLIGINTAIASDFRFGVGVGFAIPSNLVRYAVEGLLKNGKIVRGYLGVMLPASIDDGVLAQLGLNNEQGALLAGVPSGSPADKAGLKAGDFITEVDGHKIASIADLRLVVAQLPIGREVEVKFIRDGQPKTATVQISEIPADLQEASNARGDDDQSGFPMAPDTQSQPPAVDNVLGGLEVSDLNAKTRQKYEVDKSITSGVVVTGTESNSPADDKLDKGDVIESLSINRGSTQSVNSAKDFASLAHGVKSDQSVVLLIHHGKASSYVFLSPEK